LLEKRLAEASFPVRGIQVDGGFEFRSVFEDACRARGLELVCLPPRRPDLNGGAGRSQATWRYEFYATYELPHRLDALQRRVDAFAPRYHTYRPHQALGGKTPQAYLKARSEETAPSHMP
jgi:transposase InsO family protein